jgi:hypothetical protein
LCYNVRQTNTPRLTTLCYIEKGGCYLILHRTKKQHDENGDFFTLKLRYEGETLVESRFG